MTTVQAQALLTRCNNTHLETDRDIDVHTVWREGRDNVFAFLVSVAR